MIGLDKDELRHFNMQKKWAEDLLRSWEALWMVIYRDLPHLEDEEETTTHCKNCGATGNELFMCLECTGLDKFACGACDGTKECGECDHPYMTLLDENWFEMPDSHVFLYILKPRSDWFDKRAADHGVEEVRKGKARDEQ